MAKQSQNLILCVLVIFSFLLTTDAQTGRDRQNASKTAAAATAAAKFEGVYAGVLLTPGLNGLNLTTYTYYFRSDGTYATEFDKPDWKTRVDGTYTLKGSTITLSKMSGNQPDTMEIKADGDIDDGSYTLHKMNVMNSVPAKRLENKSASSVGGMGTGLAYVGVFSNRVFIFDGKGNFSNDDESTTAVIGDNIGGGTSGAKKGGGTYTIKDSVLTLRRSDGTTDTKSFFYSEKPEVMALINGSFYYEYEDESADKNLKAKTVEKSAPEINRKSPTAGDAAPSGFEILKRANAAHGGKNLDDLKTIRMTGKMSGANGALDFDATISVNVIERKIRYEFRKNGELVNVEQFEGSGGWNWLNGQKTALTEKRINELDKSLSTGVFGLRSDALKTISVESVKIDEEKKLKTLRVKINGEEYGWLFDAENRLTAEASKEDGAEKLELSSDFRNVKGVVVPFSSGLALGSLTVELKLSSVEVNPTFSANDWAIPK